MSTVSRVVVTGATGLIGRAVVAALRERGDEVVALTRSGDRAGSLADLGADVRAWPSPTETPPPADALAGADAVVNLLGEPIAQRWSGPVKEAIRSSRVLGTRQLVSALRALEPDQRPAVLVSQSAIGFYGPLGDGAVDETSPPGSDFVADVAAKWEAEALAVADIMRVAVTRTGVVLARDGALAKMLPIFRLGIAGPIASGRQVMSWIHLDDAAGATLLCLSDAGASGPINFTSPGAVDNRAFTRALAAAIHRPAVIPVPTFALRLAYGEMAEVLTTGQRVVPARLQALGYDFRYPEINGALRAILGA
jgi:uncharacterized protein (TIGR01777 family)